MSSLVDTRLSVRIAETLRVRAEEPMKILLYVNALFEGVFGIVAIAVPQTVWSGADALAQSLGRAFGFAAVSVAVLSLLAARASAERSVRTVVLGGLVAWHLGLTVAELLAALQHLAPSPVVAIHGLFTLAFVIARWRVSSVVVATTPLAPTR